MIKLLGEKILIRPYIKTVTKKGIIIPETAQQAPTYGQVLKIGTHLREESGCDILKVDDWVKYYPFVAAQSMNWIKLSGELLLIIRPDDVIGIIQQSDLPSLEDEPTKLSLVN